MRGRHETRRKTTSSRTLHFRRPTGQRSGRTDGRETQPGTVTPHRLRSDPRQHRVRHAARRRTTWRRQRRNDFLRRVLRRRRIHHRHRPPTRDPRWLHSQHHLEPEQHGIAQPNYTNRQDSIRRSGRRPPDRTTLRQGLAHYVATLLTSTYPAYPQHPTTPTIMS